MHNLPKGKSIIELVGSCRLYANGRQALDAIAIHCNIKRLLIPSYYCHESVEGLRRPSLTIEYYPCNPMDNQDDAIANLNILPGDGIVRMNFFGLNSKPRTPYGNFTLIEDHSHCLTSDWALNSEADWCFASLRKTMPIADGGILWSPKGRTIPLEPSLSQYNLQNSSERYAAMSLKTDYLNGENIDKQLFLAEFRRTEEILGALPESSISQHSKSIVSELDIISWNNLKKNNWNCMVDRIHTNDTCTILKPQTPDIQPFSFVIIFNSEDIREKVRMALISDKVFPAVLWSIPEGNYSDSIDLGNRMLSIHCDGRYTTSDIIELSNRINKAIAQ